MITKVLYIDDQINRRGRDAQKIKELLDVPGKFECDLKFPPRQFSDLPKLPDALLVDHDLSTGLIDGENIDYYGSSLAHQVRIRQPECPIALITRENILAPEVSQLLEESNNVDLIIYKNDVYKNPDEERDKIIALIDGFKALDAISHRKWRAVIESMGADEDEAKLLREAAPPVTPRGEWNVPQVARWIRNVIMEFPGILYDDLTAATRLGINLNSFRKPRIQKLMAPAKYTGVFSTYQERWWRGRLFNIAQGLMLKHDLRGSTSQKFAEAYHASYKEKLNPAICVYDKTPVADWVCYILERPVKQQNSIPYYPDNRPPVMDQARVSFAAIEESDEFDENLVDADSFVTVRKGLKIK